MSLQRAKHQADPVVVRPLWPSLNHSTPNSVTPIPLMYTTAAYRECSDEAFMAEGPNALWLPLIRVVAGARLLREPLCTLVNPGALVPSALFSFGRFPKYTLPAHLFSELAFHKWSARHDEDEMYSSNLTSSTDVDLAKVSHWPVRRKGRNHVMIFMPWMQMGGSEKCMLDVAQPSPSTLSSPFLITVVIFIAAAVSVAVVIVITVAIAIDVIIAVSIAVFIATAVAMSISIVIAIAIEITIAIFKDIDIDVAISIFRTATPDLLRAHLHALLPLYPRSAPSAHAWLKLQSIRHLLPQSTQ